MPRGAPKYLKRGRYAAVRIAGREYHLGTYGTDDSKRKYNLLLSAWIAAGRPSPWGGPGAAEARGRTESIEVCELADLYLKHAVAYYRKEGKPTSEVHLIRRSMRALVDAHATTRVADFGPAALRDVRSVLLADERKRGGEGQLARATINHHIARVKRAFKWAVSEELAPPSIYHALQTVPGLKRGRTTAPETDGVFPVPRLHLARTMRRLPRQVAVMVRLQLLTGMRPGEVVRMRPRHLEIRDGIWIYRPPGHKMTHHEKRREVFIGPRAQRVLLRTLPKDLGAPVFPSKGGKAWTVNGYRRAITKACKRSELPDKTAVPRWNPRQLRKNTGKVVRDRYGLDAAQAVLGHSKADTTEIYADVERAKAEKVAREIG